MNNAIQDCFGFRKATKSISPGTQDLSSAMVNYGPEINERGVRELDVSVTVPAHMYDMTGVDSKAVL